jgi:selenocysteine-specific elongation factor
MLFHREALDALKRDLGALKAGAPDGHAAIDVGMFKERYGLSRKYAIPLLEYLDRERLTRRVGDVRQLI